MEPATPSEVRIAVKEYDIMGPGRTEAETLTEPTIPLIKGMLRQKIS
jgi:hypothetical protein